MKSKCDSQKDIQRLVFECAAAGFNPHGPITYARHKPSLAAIGEAYKISRQRIYKMRRTYGLVPHNFTSPELIFNVLLKGPSSKLRSRLTCSAERLKIAKALQL